MHYQVQVDSCSQKEVDFLCELLEEKGSLAITLTDSNDDPILEPELGTTPIWPEVTIKAIYATTHDAESAIQHIVAHYAHLDCSIQVIPHQDWQYALMRDFKSQCFGKRLWVCPSWETPSHPAAVNLMLDPGLAFGTGSHPTTSLCLTWLDQADLNDKTFVDYGCGSGILAIAALKLGAAKGYAVDIDEQALQATRQNASHNCISTNHLSIDFPQFLSLQENIADIVMANILLTPLLHLQDQFSILLRKKGLLVVSGILDTQVEALVKAYEAQWAHQAAMSQEGWSLLVFEKR